MQALLNEIKNLNILMLPYLKQDTYDELTTITHRMIALFNQQATDEIHKKLLELLEFTKRESAYKSQLAEANSKLRSAECEMSIMRAELELLRNHRKITSQQP